MKVQQAVHAIAGLAAATCLASTAQPVAAQGVGDIDSVVVQERRFNDFPTSTLVTTENYPTLVRFAESNYGTGNPPPPPFANQHVARLSSDDSNPFAFQNNQAFAIGVDVNLDAGTRTGAQRKEAGFRSDTFIAGESFFIATADGEVAAFGGPFPFFSFGTSAYTPGTTARLELIYTPDDDPTPTAGDAATLEYRFNGMSSGRLDMLNLENGIINGSDLGFYLQSNPDEANANDFANASFANITVVVPEPAAACLLLLTGSALALRRRR